jgi:hypothetical protein
MGWRAWRRGAHRWAGCSVSLCLFSPIVTA